MKQNVTFSIGSIGMIDKINDEYGLVGLLFGSGFGRAKNIVSTAKLLIANRFDKVSSVHRLTELYPEQFFQELGFEETPKERNLYRAIERIGERFNPLVEKYQLFAKNKNLITLEQFTDFSSAYFEGTKSALGALGYSRDGQPGKKQITFGISTGINNVPAALTIQKGNVQDKKHMRVMFNTCKKIMPAKTMFIFDCGGNTIANKKLFTEHDFEYLTLKPKKRTTYKKYINFFHEEQKQTITFNDVEYACVKTQEANETQYLFYSEKLKKEQIQKRKKKFKRLLEKNQPLISKALKGKELAKHPTNEGYVIATGSLQKTLTKIENPFITGLEGYFILESSVDAEIEKILKLYKERDKAEKLIRNIKEGTELRPMRHWTKNAILGYIFIIFLTNCIIALTQLLTTNPLVKNTKLLKKYLTNLTLTIVYPKKAFQIRLLSNISTEIEQIFSKTINKYGSTSIDLRW